MHVNVRNATSILFFCKKNFWKLGGIRLCDPLLLRYSEDPDILLDNLPNPYYGCQYFVFFFWFLVKAVDLMDLDFAAAFFQFFCCLPFLSLSFKHKTPVSITRNTFNRGFLYWFSTQFFCITIFHPSRLLRVRPIGHSSKLQFPHYLRSHVKRPVLSHLASSERRTQWWWPWASTGKLVRWKFEHFTLWCDAIQHSRL